MELDLADVKPSLVSFLVVGLMAIAFIALAKFAVNTVHNPITDLFRPIVDFV